ncbi:uroporphyrinogen decarboxylase family protein [Desulfitobacterium sp.]|uniref:uroporphyrinogen decarboxylase family protein n=1 Tax=Desulfitobacterium sp. TaxID=49981 RepID=UPI002B2040C2|nr:uroporphyrinogen decarboxylase family protein [Desulfitobacterium sp.]MEA4902221.1 uroporphyrinogen decarboxylase family protein [Desulfitobacterium sp.]
MRPLERVRAALNFTETDTIPVFLECSGFVAVSRGISLMKYLHDVDTLVETCLTGIKEFKADVISIFLDSCVEAEALGSKVIYSDFEYPTISSPLIKDWREINQLSVPDPWTAGRMPFLLQAAERIMAQDKGEHFVAGQVLGPVTIATQIFGIENLLYLIADDPDGLLELLKFTSQVTEHYVESLLSIGVDGVILHDPSASPEVVSNPIFMSLIAPLLKSLIQRIQDKKRALLWLQITGNTSAVLPLIAEMDVQLVTVDSPVNLQSASEILAEKVIVGNANPLLFRQATQEEFVGALQKMINQSRPRGYILGTGCEIPLDAGKENVKLFFKYAGRE